MYIIRVRNGNGFETHKYKGFGSFCDTYMQLLETGYTMYFKCDDYKNQLSIAYFERRDYGEQTTEN